MEPRIDKAQSLSDYAAYVNPMKARILAHAGLDLIEGRREGARVYDQTGRCFIDCVSSAGSFNVGRRNPVIVDVLKKALDELDLGNFLLCSQAKAELGKRLAEVTPGDLTYTMFGASGGEVVDFAIKLARGYTRRPKVISALKGYHGHTGFALSAIGRDAYQEPFRPLVPHFERVPFGEINALEQAIDTETAAVILEPIQGEGGINLPPEGYLRAVRDLCTRLGALLILDEIQTGFGRTGRLFACEVEGVVPDILTLGKSLGGGLYPIAAAVFRPAVGDFLVANPFIHLSTFGGADLGCAVGCATIDYIIEHDLPGNAAAMGSRFLDGFAQLKRKHGAVLQTYRGRGLMLGLEFVDPSMGPRMSLQLAERGVLAIYTGNDPRVMRIQPPLVIDAAEVDTVLTALDGAMGALLGGAFTDVSQPAHAGAGARRRRPRPSDQTLASEEDVYGQS